MREIPDTADPAPTQTPSPVHLLDYWATVFARTWKGALVSSFLTPLLYVVAMGVVLGGFVEGDPATLEGADSYLAFVAPGLIAAQAMTIVFGELTYPVMGMIKWHRTYLGMIATPLRISDVVHGQLGYVLFRVAITSAVFVLVMAPFGVYQTAWGAVLAFGVQLLVGAAFAGPLLAFSATLKNESWFALVFRLGMIPMFLFSGAFFPVQNLATPLEWLAKVTPLWHGVGLTRMCTLDTLDTSMVVVHLVYLATLAVLGWRLAIRNLRRRLIT